MEAGDSFFRNKAALVTGASSGIGEELAWQLAQAGAMVTLAARRREMLEKLAAKIVASGKRKPSIVECDVTRDGALERAVAETVHEFGRLDIAIANAGFGVVGPLKQLSIPDYRRQFETNVFGVMRTIYAALPEIEKTKGNIVIIGSVAGWVPLPGGSAYGMSKFALRSLASSIAPELEPLGIKVTLISPGFVASNIGRVDNQGNLREKAPNPPPPGLAHAHRQGGAANSARRRARETRSDHHRTRKASCRAGTICAMGVARADQSNGRATSIE